MRRTLHQRSSTLAIGLTLVGSLALTQPGCVVELEDGPAGPRGSRELACRGDACRELPALASRAPRLSHDQWEEATRDLLRLDSPSGLSSTFLGDATSGTFDNRGDELSVGGVLWSDYQRAAELLAEQVAQDAGALARILPTDLPSDPGPRARAFIEGFGARAHRRPLTSAEVDRYVTLFDTAPALYPEHDAFTAGVRMVLEAMLQSPHFVYRIELSSVPSEGVIALNGWEIASRLSFALWNSMPDDELFRAAAAGELEGEAGVRAQAMRMLGDERARRVVERFHAQLLSTDAYADVSRSASLFPAFTPELRTSMQRESSTFVDHVVFEERRGLRELLTAPYTFVDRHLAAVYGLPGSYGDTLERVDLDPDQRAGLLTQIGFLTVNSSSTDPDAIHRGVFINHRILCAPLPPPPMVVPPLPAEDPSMPRTMRQRIDLHTGPGTCGASCHGTMINPIGFAFEHYDALGQWRVEDRSLPVDASSEYEFAGGAVAYDGGPDLATVMAEQRMAHACYAEHWLEYAFGRSPARTDARLVSRLTEASLGDDLAVQDLVIELVASAPFRTRATGELEEMPEASP